MEGKIRVFISYGREDSDIVHKLRLFLENCDIDVINDDDLIPGTGFPDQIKNYIANAHVFMPVITIESSQRGWVHQEIGYAMALNIPVFPVTIDHKQPEGMANEIHALRLDKKEESWKNQLNHDTFKNLIEFKTPIAMYNMAVQMGQRAEMIADFANNVLRIGKSGIVRQKGGLSSFHLPNTIANKKPWRDRIHSDKLISNHMQLQYKERKTLEKHVDKKGCRLLIRPINVISDKTSIAAKARINTLIEFLDSKKDDKVVIAIQKDPTIESLTIVGDWFLAESVSFKKDEGYTHTFFTRNATEILERIDVFEEELKLALEDCGWTEGNSRVKTIEELNRILKNIKD